MLASAIVQIGIAIDEAQESQEICEDPTYAGFAHSIHDSYIRLGHFANEQAIHFPAQGNQWELHLLDIIMSSSSEMD